MNWIKVSPILTVNIELLSYVIDRIGSTDFDITLLHFINEISPVPISELCGYVFAPNANPVIAGWCGVRADTVKRIDKYVEYQYRKDPFLQSLPKPIDNTNFVQAISGEMIKDAEYHQLFFEQPNFQTEVVLARREKTGWNIAKFSLEEGHLTPETILQIGQIGALIYPLGKRHSLNSDNTLSDRSRPKVIDRLNSLLKNRFPKLTQRERQVCTLTILGNSAQKIGESLNVSPNTVITYRKRAYERLGVSNAHSLMMEII